MQKWINKFWKNKISMKNLQDAKQSLAKNLTSTNNKLIKLSNYQTIFQKFCRHTSHLPVRLILRKKNKNNEQTMHIWQWTQRRLVLPILITAHMWLIVQQTIKQKMVTNILKNTWWVYLSWCTKWKRTFTIVCVSLCLSFKTGLLVVIWPFLLLFWVLTSICSNYCFIFWTDDDYGFVSCFFFWTKQKTLHTFLAKQSCKSGYLERNAGAAL